MFANSKEAEVYLRPSQAFVVWVGQEIGIMNKTQCIKATQRLVGATMCGPLLEEEAMAKWKEVKNEG